MEENPGGQTSRHLLLLLMLMLSNQTNQKFICREPKTTTTMIDLHRRLPVKVVVVVVVVVCLSLCESRPFLLCCRSAAKKIPQAAKDHLLASKWLSLRVLPCN